MKIKASEVFEKNLDAYESGERLIVNQGGTSSTKTYSLLQLMFFIAFNSKTHLTISIVSQSLPHLKLGAIRDFKLILESFGIIPDDIWMKTDNVFSINKSIIELYQLQFLSSNQDQD